MKPLRKVFADYMLTIGKVDPRLVVMVGDISHGILQPFANECEGRYFNIGICEPTIVNMGAGIAKSGLIPVMHTIAPFLIERSFEQIKLDFGYQNFGGNFITVGSAFDYAQLGCSHHCYSDIPLMMQFERSQIFYPASQVEFEMLFQASYDKNKINYFRLPEKSHNVLFEPSEIEVGKGICVVKGEDLTLLAIGPQLTNCLEVQKILEKRGVSVEVLYYPTLKPFDQKLVIQSVSKTRRILVVEEIYKFGGMFSMVLEVIRHIPGVISSAIHIQDFIHSYGTYEELCEEQGFSVDGILRKIDEDFSITTREKAAHESS